MTMIWCFNQQVIQDPAQLVEIRLLQHSFTAVQQQIKHAVIKLQLHFQLLCVNVVPLRPASPSLPSSPCQNGGTCMDADGLSTSSSCRCPPGFSGDFCERAAIAAAAVIADSCRPNPCLNGGNCTSLGSAFHCACHKPFAGADCSLKQQQQQQRPKARPRPPAATGSADNRPLALAPQHYSLPAHTFHKLLRPPERDLLKITLKETVHPRGVLVTHGQLLCFGLLALLTCLVVLGTTGIVFFGRCEAWLANAKYSQLVRQQREHLLREAGGSGQEEQEHSVNIILPEKIRLSSFGRHYTSI